MGRHWLEGRHKSGDRRGFQRGVASRGTIYQFISFSHRHSGREQELGLPPGEKGATICTTTTTTTRTPPSSSASHLAVSRVALPKHSSSDSCARSTYRLTCVQESPADGDEAGKKGYGAHLQAYQAERVQHTYGWHTHTRVQLLARTACVWSAMSQAAKG